MLLILLSELGKRDKMQGLIVSISDLCTLSYFEYFEISFLAKNVLILSLCT